MIDWRCINRLEHGKRICKHSATLEENALQRAVVGALNEMFRQQTARETLNECLTSALAGEGDELSLPAVTARLRGLQARQMELLRLIMDGGVDCTSYDEELNRVNTEKLALLDRKAELEREGRSADEFDRRIAEISGSLAGTGGAIEEFDEVLVRQLVSNIKVMDQERILVRFQDGTEVEQRIEKAPCT